LRELLKTSSLRGRRWRLPLPPSSERERAANAPCMDKPRNCLLLFFGTTVSERAQARVEANGLHKATKEWLNSGHACSPCNEEPSEVDPLPLPRSRRASAESSKRNFKVPGLCTFGNLAQEGCRLKTFVMGSCDCHWSTADASQGAGRAHAGTRSALPGGFACGKAEAESHQLCFLTDLDMYMGVSRAHALRS
jgi:hypothetical protein